MHQRRGLKLRVLPEMITSWLSKNTLRTDFPPWGGMKDCVAEAVLCQLDFWLTCYVISTYEIGQKMGYYFLLCENPSRSASYMWTISHFLFFLGRL